MAKPGVFEADVTKATELKKELQRLVKAIVEEDDELFGFEAIDQASLMLCALKDLKLRKSLRFNVAHQENDDGNDGKEESLCCFPQEFRCPISKKLMCDPVIVATGQVCVFFIWVFSVFLLVFLDLKFD